MGDSIDWDAVVNLYTGERSESAVFEYSGRPNPRLER